MLNIYFIAAHGENFRRLPEFLAGPNVRITLICCTSSLLRKSEFIDEVITVSRHPKCTNFAQDLLSNTELLSEIDGWVIFASDDDLYKVAHSDIDQNLKLKLLPVQNPDFINLVGSKAEFIRTCIENRIPIPRSEIAISSDQIKKVIENFPAPFVVKGDQGSSGAVVRIVSGESKLAENPVPDSWYPIVVQAFVKGDPRGVDAFFRNGHLLAWIYSGFLVTSSEFGPSLSRRYIEPPTFDFVEALQKYGATIGAHGFANCSFFYLAEENRHLTFEIDLRTNAWHHLGQKFGIDWIELMTDPMDELVGNVRYPTQLPPVGLEVTHWQRHIEFAIHNRDWRTAIHLLRTPKNERFPVKYKDESLNQAQVQGLRQLAVVAIAQSCFELLPRKLRRFLKESGATGRFASKIASR